MSRSSYHNFAVVSADPLILTGEGISLERDQALIETLERLRSWPLYYLSQNWWSHELPDIFAGSVATLRDLHRRFPEHRFLAMCNTAKEVALFREAGLPCAFISTGIFTDERIFQVQSTVVREFDAILNASLVPWKRQDLCRQLKSLALTYAPWHPLGPGQEDYPQRLRALLPFAHFVNQPAAGDDYRFLGLHEVAELCNRSRVGLALSAVEGTTRAVVEYLLCGLPVVTTPNLGGRDELLDPRFSRHVEPDPDRVAAAVHQLIAAELSPWDVRNAALRKLEQHRDRFIQLVDALYRQVGRKYSFRLEWDAMLGRSHYMWRTIDELMQSIDDVGRDQARLAQRLRG